MGWSLLLDVFLVLVFIAAAVHGYRAGLLRTAAVSVVRRGLFEAATATGSADIPATEPAPWGTCSA